jgi:hypothetical protein
MRSHSVVLAAVAGAFVSNACSAASVTSVIDGAEYVVSADLAYNATQQMCGFFDCAHQPEGLANISASLWDVRAFEDFDIYVAPFFIAGGNGLDNGGVDFNDAVNYCAELGPDHQLAPALNEKQLVYLKELAYQKGIPRVHLPVQFGEDKTWKGREKTKDYMYYAVETFDMFGDVRQSFMSNASLGSLDALGLPMQDDSYIGDDPNTKLNKYWRNNEPNNLKDNERCVELDVQNTDGTPLNDVDCDLSTGIARATSGWFENE